MRVLITGGRNYDDQDLLDKTLDALHAANGVTTLIHGDASGADRLAQQWAQSRGVSVEPHPADWKKYGRAAGPVRNQTMLANKPDQLVAFTAHALVIAMMVAWKRLTIAFPSDLHRAAWFPLRQQRDQVIDRKP